MKKLYIFRCDKCSREDPCILKIKEEEEYFTKEDYPKYCPFADEWAEWRLVYEKEIREE